jgi:hypothetical protein
LAILSLNAVTDIVLTSLNNFPLYPLLLWMTDPASLPGGIIVDVYPTSSSDGCTYLKLRVYVSCKVTMV